MTDVKSSKDDNSISNGNATWSCYFLGNMEKKAEVAELVDALDSGSSGE